MEKPLVSVLIGAYNAEQYLAEAIDSVLDQDYRPLELVVIDDGSTDGTANVAWSYGSALRCERHEHAGMGAGRNRAVELAVGELFAFLDADDRFVAGKLDRQWEALQADATLDVVFGHVSEFVSPELTDEQRASIRPPVPKAPWTTPNIMLIRREAYFRVGPFSESLKVGIGADWYARALEVGLRGAVLPDVVLERRLHLDNNGLRESDSRSQYLQVLKASLDRRRMSAGGQDPA